MSAPPLTADRPVAPAPSRSARRLAGLLMGGALLSKLLGLVREILIARAIGASVVADGFRGGLTAVLLPLAFLQGETVPAILIPAYREWDAAGEAPARFGALTVALTALATALFAAVELSAPLWIDALLGGFSADARALTLRFTRVMALAMPGSVLLCCLSACEIARGRSRITAVRATLLNVAVIGGVCVLLLTGEAIALAWSFALAFDAVAAWGTWLALRDGSLRLRGIGWRDAVDALRLYLRRLRPLLLQPVAEQGEVWIERLLASALAVGTVASLDYARTLSDSAVLLVGQPIGLAVLSRAPEADPRGQMDALARPVLALALPASVFLVCFAPDIVQVVFARGAFGADAIRLTADALRGIGAGLWATTLGYVLLRMLNAAGRNRRATAIVSVAFAANAAVAAVLVPWWGVFALGFGEALRGVVVLLGVSLALGGGTTLLRALLATVPGLALLAALLVPIGAAVSGPLPRLGCGAAATVLAAAVCVATAVPRATLRRVLR